jgi:hypothetical protein
MLIWATTDKWRACGDANRAMKMGTSQTLMSCRWKRIIGPLTKNKERPMPRSTYNTDRPARPLGDKTHKAAPNREECMAGSFAASVKPSTTAATIEFHQRAATKFAR